MRLACCRWLSELWPSCRCLSLVPWCRFGCCFSSADGSARDSAARVVSAAVSCRSADRLDWTKSTVVKTVVVAES